MSVASTLRVRRTTTTEVVRDDDGAATPEPVRAGEFDPWAGLWDDDGPWSRSDARTAFSTGTVGLVILGWAWWEASGSADLDTQTGWLVVGVLGVIVVLKGLVSWLRGGWRAVRVRRAAVVRAFEAAGLVEAELRSGVEPFEIADDGSYVTVAGSKRFHRRDCLLVRGKPVSATAGGRSLRGCEMCKPSTDEKDAG
jgi:hypothetical protein